MNPVNSLPRWEFAGRHLPRLRMSAWLPGLLVLLAALIAAMPARAASTGTMNLSTHMCTTGSCVNTSWAGNILTVQDGADITITGAVSNGTRIVVADNATATITLDPAGNVSIATGGNGSPLLLGSHANLTLVLPDGSLNNVFDSSSIYAGIQVPPTATLTIQGQCSGLGCTILDTGSLKAFNTGGSGAGIGGGRGSDSGTINIEGGTITAQSIGGAGIGGGDGGIGSGGSNGTINISGGTVTVQMTPTSTGAAIGGGRNGNGGTINISGGTVTVTGGAYAAGIGGGNGGSGGTITISGGTIDATGKNGGAGIGGGSGGSSGDILIYGQTTEITATSIGAGGSGAAGNVFVALPSANLHITGEMQPCAVAFTATPTPETTRLVTVDLPAPFNVTIELVSGLQDIVIGPTPETTLSFIINMMTTNGFDFKLDGYGNSEITKLQDEIMECFGSTTPIDFANAYRIEFLTRTSNTATADGITATGMISPGSPQKDGITITVTITLSGTASADGALAVELRSNILGGAIPVLVSPARAVGTGDNPTDTYTYTFTMPARDVTDLVVYTKFKPAIAPAAAPIPAFGHWALLLLAALLAGMAALRRRKPLRRG
jgi:hypothetical protein